jgi:hypothetical protein
MAGRASVLGSVPIWMSKTSSALMQNFLGMVAVDGEVDEMLMTSWGTCVLVSKVVQNVCSTGLQARRRTHTQVYKPDGHNV